jgi:xylulose-5-phosphate/fructose-6-phosphate phosphoketolase
MNSETLTPELLHRIDAYWRAANYLSVGQIYLYDNPLLKEPLKLSHVKPLVVGTGARRRVRTSSTCI